MGYEAKTASMKEAHSPSVGHCDVSIFAVSALTPCAEDTGNIVHANLVTRLALTTPAHAASLEYPRWETPSVLVTIY